MTTKDDELLKIIYSAYGVGVITVNGMKEIESRIAFFKPRLDERKKGEEIEIPVGDITGIKNAFLIIKYHNWEHDPQSRTKKGEEYKKAGIDIELGVRIDEYSRPYIHKFNFFDIEEPEIPHTYLFDVSGVAGFTRPFVSSLIGEDIPIPFLTPKSRLKLTEQKGRILEQDWRNMINRAIETLEYFHDYGRMEEMLIFSIRDKVDRFRETQINEFYAFINGEKSLPALLSVLEDKDNIAKDYYLNKVFLDI